MTVRTLNQLLTKVFDLTDMLLILTVGVILFLIYYKSGERNKAYLGFGFTLIGLKYLLKGIADIGGRFVIPLRISDHWVGSIGIIIFSYVVVKLITESRAISKAYLLASVTMTSIFALCCYLTVNPNLLTYNYHWTHYVWMLVQATIYALLVGALGITWFKNPGTGVATFTVVFSLWMVSRLFNLSIVILPRVATAYLSLTDVLLQAIAAVILFRYALISYVGKIWLISPSQDIS